MKCTTDYAIRIILYLSIHRGVIPSQEIAQNMEIPPNYLMKIVRNLRENGLVGAEQGSQGGYYMKRPIEDISLMDVIDSVEVRDGRGARWDGCGALRRETEAYRETCWFLDEMKERMYGELSFLTIQGILDGRQGREMRQEEK